MYTIYAVNRQSGEIDVIPLLQSLDETAKKGKDMLKTHEVYFINDNHGIWHVVKASGRSIAPAGKPHPLIIAYLQSQIRELGE